MTLIKRISQIERGWHKRKRRRGSVGENRRKGLDLEEETITALLSVLMIFNNGRRQTLTTDNTDQTDFH
jgi:hypothetical protein